MESDGIPAPSEGLLMTHFLTVREVARSRRFYSEVLGGQVVLDENPCIVKLANSWIIMNRGGGPTPDKPDVTPVPPGEPHTVSSFMNLRVADIEACYAQWSAKGAEFLTPPIDRRAEVRCYLRDPDRYLIEVGQATGHRNAGMLEYWNTGRYFRPHRHRHRFRVVLPPQAAPMTLPPARSRHAADSLIRAGHQTSGAVEGFPGMPGGVGSGSVGSRRLPSGRRWCCPRRRRAEGRRYRWLGNTVLQCLRRCAAARSTSAVPSA